MRWYLVVISLVLYITATNSMNNCTMEGDIRLKGLNTTCILAGRVELCYRSHWRAVCHSQWNRADAMVVCRQLGFPHEGAIPCTRSCFGRNDDLQGLFEFKCSGNENSLGDCASVENNGCGEHAGVICYAVVLNYSTFYPPSTEVTTAILTSPTTEQCNCAATSTESTFTSDMENTSTAIEISLGLGGVSATLVLVLIGVVIGWVCTCYKPSKSQHSSQEPTDSPITSHTPRPTLQHPDPGIKESGEKIYQELEQEKTKEGNYCVYEEIGESKEVYHALGDAVEGKRDKLTQEIPIYGNTHNITILTTTNKENEK